MERIPYFQRSYVFEASQFATLKTKHVEAFYKFGHCTASHAHPDKMNVEIRAFGQRVSHDLSNCGYAAKLCAEFHRTSVCIPMTPVLPSSAKRCKDESYDAIV